MQKKLTLGWLAPVLWLFGSLAILSAIYRMWITTDVLAAEFILWRERVKRMAIRIT